MSHANTTKIAFAHQERPARFTDCVDLAHEMEGDLLDHILVDALNAAPAVRIVHHFVDLSKITLAPANGPSREKLQRVCE